MPPPLPPAPPPPPPSEMLSTLVGESFKMLVEAAHTIITKRLTGTLSLSRDSLRILPGFFQDSSRILQRPYGPIQPTESVNLFIWSILQTVNRPIEENDNNLKTKKSINQSNSDQKMRQQKKKKKKTSRGGENLNWVRSTPHIKDE